MTDLPSPPASPLAAAQARAGLSKPSKLPSITVDWDGVSHTVAIGQFTIREKYSLRVALKAHGLPTDDEDLLAGAAIWVHLHKLDDTVTLDEVLDGIHWDDISQGDTSEVDSPEV